MAQDDYKAAMKLGRPWFVARWSAAAALLVLPLVAMQFTDEVDWAPGDFVFAGILIGATGLAFELALRASGNLKFRAGVVVTLGTTFLLVWVSAAVGIIGSSANEANLLYGLIVAIIAFVAIATRFAPVAMARATAAAAAVQGLIAVAAVLAGWGEPANTPAELLGINAFFIVLWLTAMLLFKKSVDEAQFGVGQQDPRQDRQGN